MTSTMLLSLLRTESQFGERKASEIHPSSRGRWVRTPIGLSLSCSRGRRAREKEWRACYVVAIVCRGMVMYWRLPTHTSQWMASTDFKKPIFSHDIILCSLTSNRLIKIKFSIYNIVGYIIDNNTHRTSSQKLYECFTCIWVENIKILIGILTTHPPKKSRYM